MIKIVPPTSINMQQPALSSLTASYSLLHYKENEQRSARDHKTLPASLKLFLG